MKEIDEVVRLISQERAEQRTTEQVENMTVPQIQEQIVRGVKVIPQELSPERIVEQIAIIHVPQVLEEVVDIVQIILRKSCIAKVVDGRVVVQRQIPTIQTVVEDSGEPTSAIP